MRSATGWRRRRSAATASFDVLSQGEQQDGRGHAGARAGRRVGRRSDDRRPQPVCRRQGRRAVAAAGPAPRPAQRDQGRRDGRHRAATRRPPASASSRATSCARSMARRSHSPRQLKQVAESGFALVALHRRARRPADAAESLQTLSDGRPFRAPIDRRKPPPGRRPLADRLRPTTPGGSGRPGASDRRGRRADAHDPLGLARLDDLLGAARHRQDHGGAAAGRRDRPCLRADFGDLFRRRRPEEGVRDGAAAPHQRPPDAAVRRRDPSLQPRPAGFLPAGHGGRHGHPGRRHHREPVLRAQRRASVARPRAGLPHARRGQPGQAARPRRRGRRQAAAARRRGEGGAACAWPTATAAPR